MSIQLIISIIFILISTGYILDKIIVKMNMSNISSRAEFYWLKLDTIQPKDFVRSLSNSFSQIFDFVYGHHIFSIRRIFGSIVSTLLSMTVIIIIVGPQNTILGNQDFSFSLTTVIFLGFSICFLNLIVDYFSLVETRFILSCVKRTRIPVLFLGVIDIILTLSIFFVGWCIFYIVSAISYSNYSLISFDILEHFVIYGFDIQEAGLFTYTTFFTSATWFLYVLTAFILRLAFFVSFLTKPFLEALLETKRPIQLFTATLSIMIIFISLIVWIAMLTTIHIS